MPVVGILNAALKAYVQLCTQEQCDHWKRFVGPCRAPGLSTVAVVAGMCQAGWASPSPCSAAGRTAACTEQPCTLLREEGQLLSV